MNAHGIWNGGFATRLEDGRGHEITVDLPTEEGGIDSGPSALELCVLSLAGCITTIFALIAKRRKLEFDDLRISLTADRPDRSPTIQRVRGSLEISTSAPKEDVETVLRLTMKTCPVGVLFEQAKIPVEVGVSLIPPQADAPPVRVPNGGTIEHAFRDLFGDA
jgi:putative redox protein